MSQELQNAKLVSLYMCSNDDNVLNVFDSVLSYEQVEEDAAVHA